MPRKCVYCRDLQPFERGLFVLQLITDTLTLQLLPGIPCSLRGRPHEGSDSILGRDMRTVRSRYEVIKTYVQGCMCAILYAAGGDLHTYAPTCRLTMS